MPAVVCPSCKTAVTDYDSSGALVCTNCGQVLEDSHIVSEVMFGESSSGAAVVHGSFVGADQAFARSGGGGSGYRKHGSYESREQTLLNGRRRITNLATVLNLPEYIADAANRWFQLAVTQNFVQGRRSQYVVAACLYVACRQQETTHMLIDFADILQVSVFAVGATYLKLVKCLQIKKIPLIDPSIYIQRFAVKLDFGEETRKVMNDAVRLVQRMGKDWLHQGRRPAGVAGACLLVAARMNNFRRSKTEIVFVAKVAEDTIQRRLDEFKLTATGALTVQDFRDTNIQSEADPPSFTKHRKRELADQRAREAKLHAIDAAPNSTAAAAIISGHDRPPAPTADTDTGHDNHTTEDDLEATLKDSQLQSITQSFDTTTNDDDADDIVNQKTIRRVLSDDPERLSDVDDDEIMSVMLNEHEVTAKSELWMQLNAAYLQEQEQKKLKQEEDIKAGIIKPPRKRKRNKPKDSSSENLPDTAAESGKAVLQKKAFSKKINYAAMDHLFTKVRKPKI
ncbi:cyclin-like protein [Lipomyces japonicus]|uniref:cyclin-like protein n=1 Tax=Lipomyces japonicus TaxID=56871 RepID=UPI0034CFF73F